VILRQIDQNPQSRSAPRVLAGVKRRGYVCKDRGWSGPEPRVSLALDPDGWGPDPPVK